jgi:protein-ribulosamine 3-kinase
VRETLAARAVCAAIAEVTGKPFEFLASQPVSGGCIHEAVRLEGRSRGADLVYFAKMNEAASSAMFEAEAGGLAALAAAGAVGVPRVIANGKDDDWSWLVLEWLDLVPLAPASAAALGKALATQHRIPHERFGWHRDNFIGASPQKNGWSEDWLGFWRERRLYAQLRLAVAKRLPSKLIDRGERLVADCEILLRGHAPARSLLHGDLWAGNAAALADGSAVLFDPATYVGDREADIAMTHLFGGYPADFLAAYRESWPLTDGYSVRRDLYNLYHVLNHANLFGSGYVRQAQDGIERLLAEVR